MERTWQPGRGARVGGSPCGRAGVSSRSLWPGLGPSERGRLLQVRAGFFLLTIKQAGRARGAPRSVCGRGIATRRLFGLKFSGRNARLRASSQTVSLLCLAPVPAPRVGPRASGKKLQRFPTMPLSGRAELGRIRSQGREGKFARSPEDGRREKWRCAGVPGAGDLPPKSSGGGTVSETIARLFRIRPYLGIRALTL